MVYQFKSFAKLNLSLYVGPLAEGGLHNIKSLFQLIDLHDIITISESKKQHKISFVGQTVPKNNTCTKILDKLAHKLKKPWNIAIKKNIPSGAGLGGGSSNAATLLNALCQLEKIPLTLPEKISLTSDIGSDIPFFFHGGTVIVSGKGEIIEKVNPLNNHVILIYPNIHCATKDIYNSLDILKEYDDLDTISKNDLYQFGYNRLFKAATESNPNLLTIKNSIENLINDTVYFSGSGSTFYYLCKSNEILTNIYKILKKNTPYAVLKTRFIYI